MSAQGNLGAQWPNYQMAGSEAHDERGTHVTRYGTGDLEPISNFGVTHHDRWWEHYAEHGGHTVERVPIEHITARQETVIGPHVRNLATVPAHVLETGAPPEEVPTGLGVGEGVILSHGHHRLAAARLRGDQDFQVRVFR